MTSRVQSNDSVSKNSDPLNAQELCDLVISAPHKQLLIIDTNIALHQIGDFISEFFLIGLMYLRRRS